MPLFDPDPMWAKSRTCFRWLLPALLVTLAFVFAGALTPDASGEDTVPAATTADTTPPVVEQSGDATPQTDPQPIPVDPGPQPDPQPQPQPDPPPAPDAQQPAETPPPTPVEEHVQTVPERGSDGGNRDAPGPGPSPAAQFAGTTFAAAPQAVVTPAGPAEPVPAIAAPLGWDVYDDALYAETVDGDGGGGSSFGGGTPPAIGAFSALGGIGAARERDKQDDAKPVSRADPLSAGGSGPGGSGPGQGPSLGLFGAGGGAGAGMALLTLLGLASGWLLLAPQPMRAFLTSTATWRPSAYVPPIEQPG